METNNNQKPDKIQNILEKIKNNELSLKPKSYYRLTFSLLIFVILLICVVTVFLGSFIVFDLHASGHAALVGFGQTGWQLFLILFPWKLLALEIILIVVLEGLLRYFKFGYKVPVLYLLLGIVCLMVVSGVVVDKTPLHTLLLQQADQHHLPGPLDDLYEGVHRPPPEGHGFYRGTVVSVATSSLMVTLDNPDGTASTTVIRVQLDPANPHLNSTSLNTGERIFIRGNFQNGDIQAHDIHDANDIPPPHHNEHH